MSFPAAGPAGRTITRAIERQRELVDPSPRQVRVLGGYQLVHDGQVRTPGEVLEVDGLTAEAWHRRGFVELVLDDGQTAEPARPRRRSRRS